MSNNTLRELIANGWTMLEGICDEAAAAEILRALASVVCDAQASSGWRSTRKLHAENLLDAGPLFDAVWFSERLMDLAEVYLGDDWYVLGARYRAPLPGAGEQTMHADDDGYDLADREC